MADIGWGWMSDSESFGKLGDNSGDYRTLTADEAATEHIRSLQQAGHGMIFARKPKILWDLYDMRGVVMVNIK